jgi:hypothetical protein
MLGKASNQSYRVRSPVLLRLRVRFPLRSIAFSRHLYSRIQRCRIKRLRILRHLSLAHTSSALISSLRSSHLNSSIHIPPSSLNSFTLSLYHSHLEFLSTSRNSFEQLVHYALLAVAPFISLRFVWFCCVLCTAPYSA